MLSSAAEITVGDVLVFFPDDDSLKEDQALGYYLAASFGKVIKTDASNVHVEWLYGETYSSTFRPFVLSNGVKYTSVIPESGIFTGDTCSKLPMKAEFDGRNRLKARTKDFIRDVIGVTEYNKYN